MNSAQKRKIRRSTYRRISAEIDASEDAPGVFHTYHVMDDWASWVDFHFLGEYNQRKTVWSCCLQNLYVAYADIIEDVSLDMMTKQFPRYSDYEMKFDKVEGTKYWRMRPTPDYVKEAFAWNKENIKDLMDTGDFTVGEKFEIHPEYFPNTGVWATVNNDFISSENVIQFIDRFKKNGQQDYVGEKNFSVTAAEFDKHFAQVEREY